ncbi:PilZ domain-containing protein [Microvirga sp. 0TCS3.31]
MDNRRSPRSRTLLQGRVVFNSRFSLIECTVKDLSDTGAQITFAHPVALPLELELEIPSKGLSTPAKVAWSSGKTHGLMFIAAAQARPSGSISLPEEADAGAKNLAEESNAEGSSPTIQEILEEARLRVADVAGVPIETVRLKLEIDF